MKQKYENNGELETNCKTDFRVTKKKNITRKIFRLVLGAQPTPRPFMFTKSGYYLKLTKNR